jgi:hypothetical protein
LFEHRGAEFVVEVAEVQREFIEQQRQRERPRRRCGTDVAVGDGGSRTARAARSITSRSARWRSIRARHGRPLAARQ